MEFAAQHVDAAGNQNPTDLFPAISLSIDLEQQQEIAALNEELECPFVGLYAYGEIGAGQDQLCTINNQTVTGFALVTDD